MPKKLLKKLLFWFAVAYLGIGAFVASVLAYVVPATNIFGWCYLVLIWPAMVGNGTFHTPAPYIPNWCFSFD